MIDDILKASWFPTAATTILSVTITGVFGLFIARTSSGKYERPISSRAQQEYELQSQRKKIAELEYLIEVGRQHREECERNHQRQAQSIQELTLLNLRLRERIEDLERRLGERDLPEERVGWGGTA